MSNTVSNAIAAAGVAVLSLASSVFATTEPASAQQFHGGGGAWHGGGAWGGGWDEAAGWRGGPVGWRGGYAGWHGGGHWHPGYWRGGNWYNGWWGPAVAAGLVLGATAAYPYDGGGYDACWQNRPVYAPGGPISVTRWSTSASRSASD